MPLEAPKIDARTFEDLLREARLRIPQYCPEWTDFNDSDPGMAIVQLFAWFTETMLFQLNQVPERNYIKFLQLLNLELRPAQPARTHVCFTLVPDSTVTDVPARSRFEVPGATGDTVIFETTQAIALNPLPLTMLQVFDGTDFSDQTAVNELGTSTFRPLGWTPQLGNALYLGFKPATDEQRGFPDRLVFRIYGAPPVSNSDVQVTRSLAERVPETLLWEYQSTDDAPTQSTDSTDRWRPLTILRDDSQGLTREGMLELRGPSGKVLRRRIGKQADDADELYWIRARLFATPFALPEIAFLRANVVEVENLATYHDEVLGESDGFGREFTLQHVPVEPTSLILKVGEETWTRQDDFLAAHNTSPYFVLNATTGKITFGDGINGLIPPPGQTIVASIYRAGGGRGGNVAANTITSPPAGVANVETVTNPRAATGGQNEESMDALKKRAPAVLRGDQRAVTLDDYRRFAEDVAGVAKATVLPNRHPRYEGLSVPGAVTVVVVPDDPGFGKQSQPLPSQELRERVYRALNNKRLLTTELFVTQPRYKTIDIKVLVVPAEGMTESLVRAGVQQSLENYLAIVRPKEDPKQAYPNGWPFGESFFPSKLFPIILEAKAENGRDRLVNAVEELVIDGDERFPSRIDFKADELPAVTVHVEVVLNAEGRR